MPPTIDQARAFCRTLTLDNAKPFELEGWQVPIVADVLSGVPEVHVWIPEANGKTTLVGAMGLLHLCSTRNPRIVVAAAAMLQARVLYEQCCGMIRESAFLSMRLDAKPGSLEIRCLGRPGGLKVISADERLAHGGINTLVLLDELAQMAGLGLYRVLLGKLQKRGGQLVGISTSGEPDSEFEQMCADVLAKSPTVERRGPRCTRAAGPRHVAWDFSLRPTDDINDMDVVKLCNPLSTITAETLRAKRESPGWEEKHWRTVVCNLPTRDFVARFLPDAEWTTAGAASEIPPGVPIMVGIDWGWTEDATAIVPLWNAGYRLVLGAAVVIEPPRNGTQLSPSVPLEALKRINERNPLDTIGHDASAYGGGQVMTGLLEEEFPSATIVPVSAHQAADAAGHFLERLRAGALAHVGDATLTRHLRNAIRLPIKGDTERFNLGRPVQSRHAPHQRAQREIDAAVAATLAVWVTVGTEPDPVPFIEVF